MLRGKIHVEILQLLPHNARFSSQARVELYHKIALCEKKKGFIPLHSMLMGIDKFFTMVFPWLSTAVLLSSQMYSPPSCTWMFLNSIMLCPLVC